MGKLLRLELFNFKSYKGHHTLLFGDAHFTSIIGPNGSGKSNSMDAISFVLGMKSSHLRSSHLKELIYRGRVIRKSIANGDAENGDDEDTSTQRDDPRTAWVMAVFQDDAEREQKWKRTITAAGTSEYRINDRAVSATQYNEALESENILIKAKNFLVFQGDVEAIAVQSPKELTKMIEQVSGSWEYKDEYEKLKAEVEVATNEQSQQIQRRRGLNGEIRQYREQKEEADRFVKKTQEKDDAVVRQVLYKLYHLQQEIDDSTNEIQKHQSELREFQKGIEKFTKAFESAKKEYTEASKDVSKTEKGIKTKEKEIEDEESELVPIDEQINISTQSLTKYANRIQTIQKERQTQNEHISSFAKDLKTVERAQAQWQAEWDQEAGKQGGQLSDADIKEYNRLREEVGKRAGNDQSRISALKTSRGPQEATYNSLKNAVEGSEYKLQTLEADKSSIEQRRTDLEDNVEVLQKELNDKRKKLTQLQSVRLQTSRARTELEEKLQEVLRKLLEADDGKRASAKEVRIKETIATLKRTYPGVKGRLHEQCKPKQKKYDEAVITVLGRHFDSIVVDTEATAKHCIEYLRDQRAGQATFIPLDTIQAKSHSAPKGIEAGVRLAIDTIDFDSSVSRAISYACGNAIVCDTLDIAKKMIYTKGIDAKAVTLDGTVIHKAGLITGGRGKEANSKRWDDAEVEKWRKMKEQFETQFNSLPTERTQGHEEQSLQTELIGIEGQIRYATDEIDALNRNIDSKQSEINNLRKQLKTDQPKLKTEKTKLDKITSDIDDFSETVQAAEDEVFANFCQRLGYKDIRDYEARQGSMQAEAQKKKLEFITQKTRIEGQISFERSKLQTTDERIATLQDRDQRDRKAIDDLNEAKTRVQEKIDELKEELEELHASLDESKQKQQSLQEKLNKTKTDLQKRSKNMDASLKAISSLEGDVKRQASGRYTILRRCKIENIQIPLEDGSSNLEGLPMNDLASTTEVDPDAMEVDSEEDDLAASALQAHEVSDYGIAPDYDELSDALKEDDSEEAVARLQDDIDNITKELTKMTPHAHATTRLGATEARMKDAEGDYKASHDRFIKLQKQYDTIANKRDQLFRKAFDHISDNISPIYSNLTRSSEFPAGGQAYLSIDETDPYLAGTGYHTMPPAKRFRDMEHLSGGEKTMAALALLFAIHSFQPSPFFVLDEVDAALDNANVQKLVTYVKNHASPGMQFIVISLKNGFFQGSEALVGVYRDQGANSSKALTLDLRKYA